MRLLLLLAASGCAASGVEDTTDTAASALGDTAGPIHVLDSGLWYRRVGCPSPSPAACIDEGHFWIDLAIRNDAYAKNVGVVWIDRVRDNPSAAWHLAAGIYELSLGDNLERWGVDVTTGIMTGIEPHPQIQFAAFVEMGGETSWDNHDGADYVIE
jgi:hypothetical protein